VSVDPKGDVGIARRKSARMKQEKSMAKLQLSIAVDDYDRIRPWSSAWFRSTPSILNS
jgi:hypothetical protein